MAYSITKPNIYFSGDKRILTETVAGGISKFNVVMTHAKDSMYYVINDSTKDTIEIAIEPFKTDTNCVLTNYIMFPNDFSGKTISFVAPDGYEIYYTGDYTRAKYTENTIIAIQHVDMGKIVVTINAGEKTEKYGVLLTLETTEPNQRVRYGAINSIFDPETKLYWNYNPQTGDKGQVSTTGHNDYTTPGTHYLLVLSNKTLSFPILKVWTPESWQNYVVTISHYKNTIPLLFVEDTGNYFFHFNNLKSISQTVFENMFDKNINFTNFSFAFSDCNSLEYVQENIFDSFNITNAKECFYKCNKIKKVPELWNTAKWPNITNHDYCFTDCKNATNYPDIPDDWK